LIFFVLWLLGLFFVVCGLRGLCLRGVFALCSLAIFGLLIFNNCC
jgi:hypothetical protein